MSSARENHFKTLEEFVRFSLIISTITLFCINFKQFYDNGSRERLFKKNSQKSYILDRELREMREHFRIHWKRERSLRTDYWSILKPCFRNTDWNQVKIGWEKSERSNASTSSLIYLETRPAREYSRLFIQSKTTDGRDKTYGGDSWRVYVRGPASIAATVFDHNNGTYEALFLVMEPGEYRLEIYLDYSLCDGLRDPPWNWFIIGKSIQKLGFWRLCH